MPCNQINIKNVVYLLNFLLFVLGVATTFPEPCEKEEFIRCQMYNPDYEPALFPEYSYPKL